MRLKVYIAGPYSSPDPVINTRIAMEWWHRLWDLGFAPFCPHLSHFLHLQRDRPYTEWLDSDNEWVVPCRALFRFFGPSSGAYKEEALARALGLPIFYESQDGLAKLIAWRDSQGAAKCDDRLEVFRYIGLEREYQDRKWGGAEFDNDHDHTDWLKWINEYANGTGRAADYTFGVRLVKTAALATAALEQMRRLSPEHFALIMNHYASLTT